METEDDGSVITDLGEISVTALSWDPGLIFSGLQSVPVQDFSPPLHASHHSVHFTASTIFLFFKVFAIVRWHRPGQGKQPVPKV